MTPVPLPAASGAYTGPETGDVLDARQLAELERLAGLRAARAAGARARRLVHSAQARGEGVRVT